jgi:heme/copper-type cytochrome/quinol oxidase subunit 2
MKIYTSLQRLLIKNQEFSDLIRKKHNDGISVLTLSIIKNQTMSLDKKQLKLKIQLELLWWVFSTIILLFVTYPIFSSLKSYDFWISNILFVLIFVTYSRQIFFLKHSFLAQQQVLKFVLIFASIPLIFKSVEWLFDYQHFIQTDGQEKLLKQFREGYNFNEKLKTVNYISSQYMFFAVATIISAIVLPFRLLISYWRVHNKHKEV